MQQVVNRSVFFLLDAIFQNSINRHLNNQIGTAVVVICTILVHAVLFGL